MEMGKKKKKEKKIIFNDNPRGRKNKNKMTDPLITRRKNKIKSRSAAIYYKGDVGPFDLNSHNDCALPHSA